MWSFYKCSIDLTAAPINHSSAEKDREREREEVKRGELKKTVREAKESSEEDSRKE